MACSLMRVPERRAVLLSIPYVGIGSPSAFMDVDECVLAETRSIFFLIPYKLFDNFPIFIDR